MFRRDGVCGAVRAISDKLGVDSVEVEGRVVTARNPEVKKSE
jgi:hypothetical protein